MRVRIISLGTNWWSAHPQDVTDPLCFRHNATWFNSAGLKYGNRLRLCWAYPGQVRFNRSTGLNPEFPNRILGRSFDCNEPTHMNGRMHLLVTRRLDQVEGPDRCLVTITEQMCGPIRFQKPYWKSDGVQLISVSLRRGRYEAMVLMRSGDWIESSVGPWTLSKDCSRLVLAEFISGGHL